MSIQTSIIKSRVIYARLISPLFAFCATTILAAQPLENTRQNAPKAAVTHPELKAFPPAKAGMERFVIVLPHKERGEEDSFKVELIPGKMMETDGTNLYHLGGALEQKNLEGWGYSFHEFVEGPVAMTLMKPAGVPVQKFVSASSLLVPYNSRLPLVIYAPAGYEIRYRIWKADDATISATKA